MTGGSGTMIAIKRDHPALVSYLSSLIDPEKYVSKIPDEVSVSTTSFQLSYDSTFTANTNSCGGIRINLTSHPDGCRVFNETSASQDNGFAYATPVASDFFFAGKASNFRACRVASASILVQYGGSTINNSGFLSACNLVYAGSLWGESAPTSVGTLLSARDNTSVAINSNPGLFIRVKQLDMSSLTFRTSTDIADVCAVPIHVSGGVPGMVFRYRLIVNFEGIPTSDSTGYTGASDSPTDPLFSYVPSIVRGLPTFSTYEQYVKNFGVTRDNDSGWGYGATLAVTLLANFFAANASRVTMPPPVRRTQGLLP
jgi:hypothetical protein